MQKVLIGLSGGIDSSYSAFLLQKQGYLVEGVYMILHDRGTYHSENIERIEEVANYLNIKYHILNLKDEFNKKVFNNFIQTYKDGKTPNPCIVCNRHIKFGAMFEFAKSLGIHKLATGHYVRSDGEFLYQAKDKTKDQSYFLFNIDKNILKHTIFPLGELLKEDVKKNAMQIEVLREIANKKESNDICFVDSDYSTILREFINPDIDGEVIKNSEVVGTHKGYMHYTIGKRKGFRYDLAQTPHYVTKIIADKNQIEVGEYEELRVEKILAKELNMFIDKLEFKAEVKIRYRSPKVGALVKINGEIAEIFLDEPVYGVAPSQAIVFYENEKLLGGGLII